MIELWKQIGLSVSLTVVGACSSTVDGVYSKGIDAYAKKNYTEAEPYIRQAAEIGHVDGMSILGAMYLFGRGVPADGKQAEYWLLKAARAGGVDAQSILGIMYATGQGVEKNLTEGLKWLQLASKQGDKQATRMLKLYSPS